MPSFDVVSKANMQEVDNAINQARKEIETRYDFRGSKSSITLEKNSITVIGDDEYKLNAVMEIIKTKMIKRGIALNALQTGKPEKASGDTLRQKIDIKQGLTQEEAKELIKHIKATNLKVQSQIMGEELRVSGKKIDDLQAAIASLKALNFKVPLQYVNFRD